MRAQGEKGKGARGIAPSVQSRGRDNKKADEKSTLWVLFSKWNDLFFANHFIPYPRFKG